MLTFILCVELLSYKLLAIGVNQVNFEKSGNKYGFSGCGFQ
jgi:hypothetical protein